MANEFKRVELHLSNGDYIIADFDISKIYGVRQFTKTLFRFVSRFPFFSVEKEVRTTFRYRTFFEYSNHHSDPKYCVKCSAAALMDMFGLKYENFTEHVVESVVKRGY